MRPETVCDAIRADVSAFVDDELSRDRAESVRAHLDSCAACSAYRDAIEQVRGTVRLQPVEDVPDMAGRIVSLVAQRGPRERHREERLDLAKVALVAALVTGLLTLGTSLPEGGGRRSVASADEVSDRVWGAAAEVGAFSAGYDIIERGWHPQVPERRFHVDLDFQAPDRVRFVMRDLTLYPRADGWPANDVDLVSNGGSWWMREPLGCPAAALPGCPQAGRSIERSVTNRIPFDGSTPLPSDLIIPLDSVAASDGLLVHGEEVVTGRRAIHVSMPFFQAERLILSLQPGGVWRAYHPLDLVDVWLDREGYFPVAIRVAAQRTTERDSWARSMGYAPEEGMLLRVGLTSFALGDRGAPFDVPRSTVQRDGGFARTPGHAEGLLPSYVAGLEPYASGSVDGRLVVAWARGLRWLRVVVGPAQEPGAAPPGEPIELGAGIGFYSPASGSGARRIEVLGDDASVSLESNLPRDTLARVASSVPVEAGELPGVTRGGGRTIERGGAGLAQRFDIVAQPTWLPLGYAARHTTVSSKGEGETISVFYGRAEVLDGDTPVRITHSDEVERLWPSSERFEVLQIRGAVARYSSGRGELEWIEDGVYRAVSAPGLDLASIAAIAAGLR